MFLSKQEAYGVIGAVGVVAFGWFVQLSGIPWEVWVVALGVLGWGFAPRVMRSIKSWKTPKSIQTFQTFTGGDELLKELERVDASCARLSGKLPSSGQDIRPVIMELDHLWIELTKLRGKYRGVWTLSLRNRVTMIIDRLHGASSALSIRDVEDTRAHLDGAVQNTRTFISELKGPPPVTNEDESS